MLAKVINLSATDRLRFNAFLPCLVVTLLIASTTCNNYNELFLFCEANESRLEKISETNQGFAIYNSFHSHSFPRCVQSISFRVLRIIITICSENWHKSAQSIRPAHAGLLRVQEC